MRQHTPSTHPRHAALQGGPLRKVSGAQASGAAKRFDPAKVWNTCSVLTVQRGERLATMPATRRSKGMADSCACGLGAGIAKAARACSNLESCLACGLFFDLNWNQVGRKIQCRSGLGEVSECQHIRQAQIYTAYTAVDIPFSGPMEACGDRTEPCLYPSGSGLVTARSIMLVLASFLFGMAVYSVPAEAQQMQQVFRVGVLHIGTSPPDPLSSPGLRPFVDRLAKLGFQTGQNVDFEYRWAEGNYERVQLLTGELVRGNVDVIVAVGNRLAQLVTTENARVPIVSVSCDPFSTVTSYARPNGNITGVTCMTTELSPKRLELVKQIVPAARKVAFLHNPNLGPMSLELTQKAALQLGLAIQAVEIRSAAEMKMAFAAIVAARPDVLLVHPDALTIRLRREIAEFALAQRLPSIYGYREFVEVGGLVSYGGTNSELGETAAELVAKILRGAKPHELPIRQVMRLPLTLNTRSARALGLAIPAPLLLRADELIE
jgi:putative ABC transport system substrate-binding protein